MQIKNKSFTPTGPIPGENYTSNTKNYPWHRPPDISDLDAGVEAVMKQLATRETSYALLTVLQTGVPVVTVADIFLTNGIGAGKWTPDIALLLAGPTCHIMKIMAEDYGIEYDMGLDDEAPPTIAFLKAKSEIDPKRAVNAAENVAGQIDTFKSKANEQAAPNGDPATSPLQKSTGFMSGSAPGGDEPEMTEPPAEEGMI